LKGERVASGERAGSEREASEQSLNGRAAGGVAGRSADSKRVEVDVECTVKIDGERTSKRAVGGDGFLYLQTIFV
jgi:hypothetical protein